MSAISQVAGSETRWCGLAYIASKPQLVNLCGAVQICCVSLWKLSSLRHVLKSINFKSNSGWDFGIT